MPPRNSDLTVLCDNRLDDNGYPIEGNRTGAMKWLLAAAEQGLPRAQSKLAEMYTDGPAAPEDDIDAVSGSLSRQRTWPESSAIEPNPDTSAFPRV